MKVVYRRLYINQMSVIFVTFWLLNRVGGYDYLAQIVHGQNFSDHPFFLGALALLAFRPIFSHLSPVITITDSHLTIRSVFKNVSIPVCELTSLELVSGYLYVRRGFVTDTVYVNGSVLQVVSASEVRWQYANPLQVLHFIRPDLA